MRARSFRWVLLGVLAAAVLTPATPAAALEAPPALIDPAAVEVVRLDTIPFTVEGELGVEFRADPATGCPAPCDLSGTLSWTPGRRGSIYIAESRAGGKRELYVSVLFLDENATTSARVVRNRPGLVPATCLDGRQAAFGEFPIDTSARDLVSAQLLAGPTPTSAGSDLLGTRCFGPSDADIAPALPVRQLTRNALVKGGTTLDFSADSNFAAAGMAGVVRSSVKLHLRPGRSERDLDDLEVGELTLPGFRTRRLRTLTATYSIERTAGSVLSSFTGTGEPALCSALDSCSVTGTVKITPGPVNGTAALIASGPRRSSRAALRAALGLSRRPRPRGTDVYGYAIWDRDTGTAAATVSSREGDGCADAFSLGGGNAYFAVGRTRVTAEYGDITSFLRDPFSTHCAGPALQDVVTAGALARGTLRRSALRHKRVTFHLDRGRSFTSEGYQGRSTSDLTLTLVRRKVELGTTTELVPDD